MLLTEFNEKKFAKTMWEEGHELGYSSGYSEGRESGYSEGRESGYSEGRESGYNEGRESGYSEGRESGYHEILKVMDEINKGNDTLDKLVSLGYDEELVKQVLEKK